MTSLLAFRDTAILYTGNHAVWCKGGCGKFRVPSCFLNEQPICPNCTSAACLQGLEIVNPASVRSKKTPSVLHQKQVRSYTPIQMRLLELLANCPQKSIELSATLQCNHMTLCNVANRLVKDGKILKAREQGFRVFNWYALPQHEEQLFEKANAKLLLEILKEIGFGCCTARHLFSKFPDCDKRKITAILGRMVRQKKLVAKGEKAYRIYALPTRSEELEDKIVIQPYQQNILDLLELYNPGKALSKKEIASMLHQPVRKIEKQLYKLVAWGLVSCDSEDRVRKYKIIG